MPPKRKAPAAKAKAGGKKAKKTEPAVSEPAVLEVKDAITKLKTQSDKKVTHKPDTVCSKASQVEVYGDYDCMLNQTNIGHNNNKFYIIQVLKEMSGGKPCYYSWNRWGRVGETGANSLKGPFKDADGAVKDFEKKFKDKTRNMWSERDKFEPMPGKYTLIEMADDDDEVDAPMSSTADTAGKKTAPSKLDKATQQLIKLIFDHDMFNSTLKGYDIDVKKMPLGKLSKVQIAKGFEVLEDIEKELHKPHPNTTSLNNLSSKFYTVIPHDFGRQVPRTISGPELLQKKMDMLAVLGDIEIATSLEKDQAKAMSAGVKDETLPNPLDINYKLLRCGLEVVDPKSKEFQIISQYTSQTMGHCRVTVKHVWKVDREDEDERFKAHSKIGRRKLLWHGTSVAVVAAILKSGLRIMPHSGGRVGRGIYFASELAKSAGYVGRVGKTGIMFLNEVVLGKEWHTTTNQCALTAPPPGHDSVVARGQVEPDPKKDTVLPLGGRQVVVPQGKPVKQTAFAGSHFSQSEYLIYRESQNRIRYLLHMEFN